MNIGILIFSFQILEYWNADLFLLSILIITSPLGKRCWHLCHAAAAGRQIGLFISALGDATGHLTVGGPPWT